METEILSLVQAANSISDISQKTEDLTMEVTGSLDEELKDIRSDVNQLTAISDDMNREMTKFKINA